MNKKDLADNKTKIFVAILDFVSKRSPLIEYKNGDNIGDDLRNIVNFSIDLTHESMVKLLLKE